MKSLLTNLAVLLIFSIACIMVAAVGYSKMMVKQNHLQQQVLHFRYKARCLEINIDKFYNENIKLRIELERLIGPEQPVVPTPKIITPSQDKSC